MYTSKDVETIVRPDFEKFKKEKVPVSFWIVDGHYNRFPVGIVLEVGETLFKIQSVKGNDIGMDYTYSFSMLTRYQEFTKKKGKFCVPEDGGSDDSKKP